MKTEFVFNRKIIGYIEDDTFYTERNPKHIFNIYHGFGASILVLAELQKRDVKYFCVIYRESLFLVKEFKCRVTDFYLLGSKYKDGDDKQLILGMDHFNTHEKQVSEVQKTLTKNKF